MLCIYIYILQYSFLNIIFVDGGVACDINSSVLVAYGNTGFIQRILNHAALKPRHIWLEIVDIL